jgi:hypothetical protein
MNDIEIKYGGKKVLEKSTPSKWNELTPDQFGYFLKLKASGISPEELLEKVTVYFLGELPADFPGINKAQLEDLCKQNLFLLESSDLMTQLIPEFVIDGQKYAGPSSGLANCKFWEYLKANSYFQKYQKTKSETELDRFIACIYRPRIKQINKDPENYNGDSREKFNENLIYFRVFKIAKLDPAIKEGIIIFWKGCSAFLQVRYPEAFQDGEIHNNFGAYGIADMMAGTKFGTVSQVKEAWLHECLVSACNMEKIRMHNKK